jgi:hypothetical protein
MAASITDHIATTIPHLMALLPLGMTSILLPIE